MRPAEEGLLLLCCALGQPVRPLSAREYRQLAARFAAAPPAEGEVTAPLLRALGFSAEFSARVAGLLDRREALHRYLAQPGLTVLTRISKQFPAALCKLGEDCPPALFLRGDAALLQTPCLALTGSRRLRPENRRFAESIGLLAAREGRTLVSGNAVGADQTGQDACLHTGGRVICFIPDALREHSTRKNVLFCSDEGWDIPFSSQRALRRNRYIHALGGISFVAQCTAGSGGSWDGALASLRARLSTVYIFRDGSPDAEALTRYGAISIAAAPPLLRHLPPPQLSIFD